MDAPVLEPTVKASRQPQRGPGFMGRIVQLQNPSSAMAAFDLAFTVQEASDREGVFHGAEEVAAHRLNVPLPPGSRTEVGLLLTTTGPSNCHVDVGGHFEPIARSGAFAKRYARVTNRGDEETELLIYYTHQMQLPETWAGPVYGQRGGTASLAPGHALDLGLIFEPSGPGVEGADIRTSS